MHSDNVSTTASETRDRKTTKPIMEKRRRARINASLSELKSLLLETIKKEGARHSKMEKADILEMTVKHLRQMQRQHFTVAAAEDPTILDKYRLGFNECASEVRRYLTSLESCDAEVKTKVLHYVANSLTGTVDSDKATRSVVSSPVASPPPPDKTDDFIISRSRSSPNDLSTATSIGVDMNNNVSTMQSLEPVKSGNVFSGLQVIPTQLPSGEIAFVLPANILRTAQPNYVIPVYTGATPLPNAVHSTLPMSVSPSIPSSQCSPEKTICMSVNCDKSYLPCATVTPVKPIPNLLHSEQLFVSSKQSGNDIDMCNRHENPEGSRDDPVWRPW